MINELFERLKKTEYKGNLDFYEYMKGLYESSVKLNIVSEDRQKNNIGYQINVISNRFLKDFKKYILSIYIINLDKKCIYLIIICSLRILLYTQW